MKRLFRISLLLLLTGFAHAEYKQVDLAIFGMD